MERKYNSPQYRFVVQQAANGQLILELQKLKTDNYVKKDVTSGEIQLGFSLS